MLNSSIKPKVEVKEEGDKKGNWKKQGKTSNEACRTSAVTSPKFKEETKELHRSIYNVGVYNQSNMITTTTKKLASYADKHCREPQK